MELKGEQFIPQTQAKVWEALNDPEMLKACINGCESIEVVSDAEYKVAIMAAVGPVKARFNGKLTMSDVVAPTSYSLTFQGNGGAAGFGKGDAAVSLEPQGKGTRLAYGVNVQVGGKLAQIGSRLIDGVGRKLAEDFFKAFNERVGDPSLIEAPAGAQADSSAGTTPGAAASNPASTAPVSGAGSQKNKPLLSARAWIWAAVVVIVAAGIIAAVV
jgi:hypothetical protein